MDPKTRRTMWNTISDLSKNKKKPSILLTTHLM
jgi:ABC-type multidrug transport system ATPase subunit